MIDVLRLNLVLEFHTGLDDRGKSTFSRITLANLRHTLTPEELSQIAKTFSSLVDYQLTDINAVYTHRVYPQV